MNTIQKVFDDIDAQIMTSTITEQDYYEQFIKSNPSSSLSYDGHPWANLNPTIISTSIASIPAKYMSYISFLKTCHSDTDPEYDWRTSTYKICNRTNFRWFGITCMLHLDIYAFLYNCVSNLTSGSILEIGTWTGGITVVIALAIQSNPNRNNIEFVAVEAWDVPYNYCMQNLINSLPDNDLSGYVKCLNTVSAPSNNTLHSELKKLHTPIKLLTIDADGQIARDLRQYLPYCDKDCIIVIDDWFTTPENGKLQSTQQCINILVNRGILKIIGVYGWGTAILSYNGGLS
jgi:predicted O-methyltransferase YrrM